MCYDESSSLAIFCLGTVAALWLYHKENPVTATTALLVSSMQLLEYFMWTDQACGAVNERASYAVIWLLWAHMFGISLAPVVFAGAPALWASVYNLVALVVAIWWTTACQGVDMCSTARGGRLRWAALEVLADNTALLVLFLPTYMLAYALAWWTMYQTSAKYPASAMDTKLSISVFLLSIVLAIINDGDDWFTVVGGLWCFWAAIFSVANVVAYSASPSWYSYQSDQLSIFTLKHTSLHMAWGALFGFATRGLDRWPASLISLLGSVGWEVFEWWHAPVTGNWTVSNAGNTALDIASWLWLFVLVFDGGWSLTPWWAILWSALLGGIIGDTFRSPSPMIWCTVCGVSRIRASAHESPTCDNCPDYGAYTCAHASRTCTCTQHGCKPDCCGCPDDCACKASTANRLLQSALKVRRKMYAAGLHGERKDYEQLEARMPIHGAHLALATICLLSILSCITLYAAGASSRLFVPCVAAVLSGFAVSQPMLPLVP